MNYLLRRLFQFLPTLLGITLIIFLVIRLVPGDICRQILGLKARPEAIELCRAQHYFDKPIWYQYIQYLNKLLHGDLGNSYLYRRSAFDLISEKLPVTLQLSGLSIFISILISVPLGILAAQKNESWLDYTLRGFSTTIISMPSFVIGLLLMLFLSLRLRLFPVSGYGDTFSSHLLHLFLPALTLAVTTSIILARNLRTNFLEILGQDYIRTARAKGLNHRIVFYKHVLRNALIPYISLLGLNLVWIIGGTVIVEQIFAIPGLGAYLLTSISYRDYEVVQSITLIFALLVMIINLLVDMLYPILDPRIQNE
jgi:peptide/nickel transport system permease protein